MTMFDWHAERSDLDGIALLDTETTDEAIDLVAVRAFHAGPDRPDAAQRELYKTGYDGVIEPGMTLCVESFIGEEGKGEGVKLEQQVLVTETGVELLSRFPFEESLL